MPFSVFYGNGDVSTFRWDSDHNGINAAVSRGDAIQLLKPYEIIIRKK